MAVNGRNKGAAFEREIAKMLHDDLGIGFKRNLEQYQMKNLADLTPDDPDFPFLLELKRYKDSVSPSWWDQIVTAAKSAANTNDALPCLIYKLDRQQTQVRIPIQALVVLGNSSVAQDIAETYDWRYTATLDWETFEMVLREHLANG